MCSASVHQCEPSKHRAASQSSKMHICKRNNNNNKKSTENNFVSSVLVDCMPLSFQTKTYFLSYCSWKAFAVVVNKPKSQFGRGTVKPVWNAAAETAKPPGCFSIKPDTTIMGIIEGYHTNLSCREKAKKDDGYVVRVFVCRINLMYTFPQV